MADDATSLFWNPAGLSFLSKRELGFSHAELYGSARVETLVYGHPTKLGSFGAGLSYLGHGRIESRDVNGNKAGDFSSSERLLTLGYAKPLGPLKLGVSVKLLQQQIAESSANAWAADLGASAVVLPSLRLGFSALNVGPPVKWNGQTSELPLTLSGGAAWSPLSRFLVSADVRQKVHENRFGLSVGLELEAYRGLFLRAGYLSASESAGAGSYAPTTLSRMRAGMGLRLFDRLSLDYSFAPAGDVGAVQRLGMGYRF